jgi:hypothetical protein
MKLNFSTVPSNNKFLLSWIAMDFWYFSDGVKKLVVDFDFDPPKKMIFKNKILEFLLNFGASKSKQNTVPNKKWRGSQNCEKVTNQDEEVLTYY